MKIFRTLLALATVALISGAALAGDEVKTVTVSGKLVCAKCSLKAEGQKECQNVIVAQQDGKEVQYYLAKNAAVEEFGHVCKGEKAVTATGTVAEKDGHTWLTATKLEQPKS